MVRSVARHNQIEVIHLDRPPFFLLLLSLSTSPLIIFFSLLSRCESRSSRDEDAGVDVSWVSRARLEDEKGMMLMSLGFQGHSLRMRR